MACVGKGGGRGWDGQVRFGGLRPGRSLRDGPGEDSRWADDASPPPRLPSSASPSRLQGAPRVPLKWGACGRCHVSDGLARSRGISPWTLVLDDPAAGSCRGPRCQLGRRKPSPGPKGAQPTPCPLTPWEAAGQVGLTLCPHLCTSRHPEAPVTSW